MKYTNYSLFSREVNQKGIEYALEHTLRLDFDAVEWIDNAITPGYRFSDLAAARAAKKEIFGRNLTVSCYSLLVNLLDGNTDEIVERTIKHIEYAAELEAPYFHHTLVPGYDFGDKTLPYDEVLSRVADNAERIAKRCNEYGIICLYEPQGAYFNGVDGLRGILSEMKGRGCKVGICGDTGNSIFVDTPPTDIYESFAEDIKHIHVKDYVYIPMPQEKNYVARSGKYFVDAPLGEGVADFKKCFSMVKNYTGDISFEMACDDEQMLRNQAFVTEVLKSLR